MNGKYLLFIKKLMIFTLLLAIPGAVAFFTLPGKYITPVLPLLYLFFFGATATVHYILLKISLKKPSAFINYFMLLTFGKLLFYLSFILVYILVFKDDAKQFAITFLILYLFFTVFEVSISLKQTKR